MLTEVLLHYRVVGACPVTTDWILTLRSCENNNNNALWCTRYMLILILNSDTPSAVMYLVGIIHTRLWYLIEN